MRGRMAALARESAMATGTEMEEQLLSSTGSWLINRTLAELLQRNLDDGLLFSFSDEPVSISDDTAEASWVTPRGGFLVSGIRRREPRHTREVRTTPVPRVSPGRR